MTAIRSLRLSHFRSHKSVRLDIDARPVAFYGPNGAGKTNALEAVSLLSPGRGLRRGSAQDMSRLPEAVGWKITADLETSGGRREVETWSHEGAARQVRLDGKPISQVALGALIRVLWLVPAMDRLWIEGADGRRRFLDRTALSFVPAHADASLRYEKAMRQRNRLLKDMVRDDAWYAALEAQMASAAADIQANRRLALSRLQEAQAQAETAFPTAELSLVTPEGDFPEEVDAFAQALAMGRPRDLAAGRCLIGPHRVDLDAVYAMKGIAARACSTGEQKALLVSVILANARALASDLGEPPLLLLDEVAAHLDAQRRAALYDEIAALGAQAWMTGTDASLFEALGPRAQYFSVSDGADGTEVRAE